MKVVCLILLCMSAIVLLGILYIAGIISGKLDILESELRKCSEMREKTGADRQEQQLRSILDYCGKAQRQEE